jgi:hypothetical protein
VITSPSRKRAVQSSGEKLLLTWRVLVSYGILVLIPCALWKWGAEEVRGHFTEVVFLTFLGGVWLVATQHLFPWFGLSYADDFDERRNPAAVIALSGATSAIGIIYAAGNLGEGPTYRGNFFSVGLGTSGFFVLWLVLELGGLVSVSIAEERDVASGIRFGAFMLAAGLILGRAIAGDWHSESATLRDFISDGWPAGVLCLAAILIEHLLRPSRARPFPSRLGCGLLPALMYLGFAAAWVFHLGRWEGMPK